MLTHKENGLTSKQRLAGFHGARALLYHAAYELLAGQGVTLLKIRTRVATALDSFDQPLPWRALCSALSGVDPEPIRAARNVLQYRANARCCEASPVLDALIRKPSGGCTCCPDGIRDSRHDLLTMASVAEQIGGAMAESDYARASELDVAQSRFFHNHAASCLKELVVLLQMSGSSVMKQLGSAIEWLVDEDLRLLSPPPVFPERRNVRSL